MLNVLNFRKSVRPLLNLIVLLAFFCIQPNILWAQSMVFRSEANSETIGLEDRLMISVHLENFPKVDTAPEVSFPAFRLMSNPYVTSSQHRNNINGRVTSKVVVSYIYELQPEKTGTFQIPPAEITVEGKKYKSNSLTIKVVEGSTQSRRSSPYSSSPFGNHRDPFEELEEWSRQMREAFRENVERLQPRPQLDYRDFTEDKVQQNIFIRQEVDKTEVYEGAPVFVKYKLYTRLPMNVSISKLPDLRGFWTEDFKLPDNPEPELETINGKEYQVFLLKKSVLYPQLNGKLTLDAAEAKGKVGVAELLRDQWGRAYINQKEIDVHIKSKPIALNVKKIPEKPKEIEQYNGAVGQIKRTVSINKESSDINEPFVLTIDYHGIGNLALIAAPKLRMSEELSYSDPDINQDFQLTHQGLSGKISFQYVIYPENTGAFKIWIPSDATYNIAQNTYELLEETSFNLKVTGELSPQSEQEQETLVFFEELHLRTPYANGSALWGILAGLIFLISFLPQSAQAQIWKEKIKAHWKATSVNPHKEALKRLQRAHDLMNTSKTTEFYEEISKALLLLISDQYHLPLSSLNKDTYKSVLLEHAIPHEQWSNIEKVIEDCELNLYAAAYQQSEPMEKTYERAKEAIIGLQQSLKKQNER